MNNIVALMDRHVADRPDMPAISESLQNQQRTITYQQLDHRVRRQAARWTRAGLLPGDRVLVLCPVGIEMYAAVLALLRCGITAVFIDPGAGLRRLDTCCRIAEPKAVIAGAAAWWIRPLVPALRLRLRWLNVDRHGAVGTDQPGPVDVPRDHEALLSFTSGSTGEPRGVVRTHGFLQRQQHAIARDLELTIGQTSYCTMPLFVLAHLAAGVHSILGRQHLRSRASAQMAQLTSVLASLRPDRLLASPAILDQLSMYCESRGVRLDMVARLDTGGAPVFPRTLDRLRPTMPRARLMVIYGSTEAEPIAVYDATHHDAALRQRIRCGQGLPAGRLTPDLQVALLPVPWQPPGGGALAPAAFDACRLGEQQTGEIAVAGKRVIRGYLRGEVDRETKINVQGQIWHRTGDLGRFDADGHLWLLGRVTARLQDARGTLEPFAVEAAAMDDAAVQRCALMPLRGRRVLIVQPAATARRGWRDGLMQQLAWAQIDTIETVRRIPLDRRHQAKVDYPALRRLLRVSPSRADETMRTVPAAPSNSTTSPS